MTQPRSTDYHHHHRHRHTFVLRLWAEPDGDALVWRYRLEAVSALPNEEGRVWTFPSLAALTGFLEAQAAQETRP